MVARSAPTVNGFAITRERSGQGLDVDGLSRTILKWWGKTNTLSLP
jgi:hypothetical protein